MGIPNSRDRSRLKEENFEMNFFCHRDILAYTVIPILQKEMDLLKDTVWNTHCIRTQKSTDLSSGVPNHVFDFPPEYGLEKCGNNYIYIIML